MADGAQSGNWDIFGILGLLVARFQGITQLQPAAYDAVAWTEKWPRERCPHVFWLQFRLKVLGRVALPHVWFIGDNSAAYCPILLKFRILVHMGLVIKLKNDCRDGRPQVAMRR